MNLSDEAVLEFVGFAIMCINPKMLSYAEIFNKTLCSAP